MVLHITNVDSADDICCVRRELEERGFSLEWYDIGQAKIEGEVSDSHLTALTNALSAKGYGVLRNPKELLVEQVKQVIQEMIFCPKFSELHNITTLLSKRTGYNYRYLSRVFSFHEKITIEHYTIVQKVERVKVLLSEAAHPLAEIAFQLNYSSVAHLSAQFKAITGETIRAFRAMHGHPRHERSLHDRIAHGRASHRRKLVKLRNPADALLHDTVTAKAAVAEVA
jgi:AraC family transcriptional regulator